ncbi:MAG: PEP-CTERM sorting domain-containing protein [Fimbriimonadaceae bacterium]|nr:MAG: PEP-CTERM sorting domain-containing protein [Fimbriimonadaceae bacterium]
MKTRALLTGLALSTFSAGAFASTVFAADIRTGRFVTFDTATPLTQTVLGTGTTWGTVRGIDFDTSGNLWAVASAAAGTNTLHTMSTANGALGTAVSITGLNATDSVNGITIAGNGTAYLSSGSAAGASLYTVNLGTGVASLIGSYAQVQTFIDVAVDNSGNIYATDITSDSLWSVNAGTGAATLIGALGINLQFAQGMDFDQSTNTLYATTYTGGGVGNFVSINTTTGAASIIAATTSTNGEYEMAVVNAVPEPATMLVLAGLAAAAARRRKSSK